MNKQFVAFFFAAAAAAGVRAEDHSDPLAFRPDTLVLSRSVYEGTPSLLVPGVTVLPPGCVAGTVNVPLIAGRHDAGRRDLQHAHRRRHVSRRLQ